MRVRSLVSASLGSFIVAAIAACSSAPEGPESAGVETTAHAQSADEARPAQVVPTGSFRGLQPYRGPDAVPLVTPTCHSPHLTYFGGPLLQSPIIVPVFWNSAVNPALTAPTTGIAQFYADVTQSSYWKWLEEYDSVGVTPGTNQAILQGTATPGVTLVPSRCPATTTGNCSVTDAQVQAEIVAQIGAGILPAPTLDCTGNSKTIYMMHFPPNIQVSGPSGAGTSCVQFCAYHNTGTYGATNIPLVYGIIMDEFTGGCASGCGGNATGLENSTDTASHELAEATTDTDIGLDTANGYAFPAGWGDNNNGCGEIGDICDSAGAGDTITVSGRSWVVQELWSNAQNKCTSTGTPLAVCSGTTVTNCRKCSCGDDGNACSGATPECETTKTNVLFGACEQCTATSGNCPVGDTCQQSTTPAQDDICTGGCVPLTTCPAGDNCGVVGDGCGGTLMCGTCASPNTCGGGGTANVCGCTPLTACPAGDDCGSVADGCGGMVTCGSCGTGDTCTANHCVANVPDSGTSDGGSGNDGGSGTDGGSHDGGTSHDSGTPDSGMASNDSGTTTFDSGSAADSSTGMIDSSVGGNDGASGEGSTDAEADGSNGAPSGNNGGCGCRTAQASEAGPSPALLAFGALAILGGVRIRRRRRH